MIKDENYNSVKEITIEELKENLNNGTANILSLFQRYDERHTYYPVSCLNYQFVNVIFHNGDTEQMLLHEGTLYYLDPGAMGYVKAELNMDYSSFSDEYLNPALFTGKQNIVILYNGWICESSDDIMNIEYLNEAAEKRA